MHFCCCCNLVFSLRLISHFCQFYKRFLLSRQNFITSLCAVFKHLKCRIDTLLNYNGSPFIPLFSYKVDSYIFSSVMASFITINFLLSGSKFLLFSLRSPISHKRYCFFIFLLNLFLLLRPVSKLVLVLLWYYFITFLLI